MLAPASGPRIGRGSYPSTARACSPTGRGLLPRPHCAALHPARRRRQRQRQRRRPRCHRGRTEWCDAAHPRSSVARRPPRAHRSAGCLRRHLPRRARRAAPHRRVRAAARHARRGGCWRRAAVRGALCMHSPCMRRRMHDAQSNYTLTCRLPSPQPCSLTKVRTRVRAYLRLTHVPGVLLGPRRRRGAAQPRRAPDAHSATAGTRRGLRAGRGAGRGASWGRRTCGGRRGRGGRAAGARAVPGRRANSPKLISKFQRAAVRFTPLRQAVHRANIFGPTQGWPRLSCRFCFALQRGAGGGLQPATG